MGFDCDLVFGVVLIAVRLLGLWVYLWPCLSFVVGCWFVASVLGIWF